MAGKPLAGIVAGETLRIYDVNINDSEGPSEFSEIFFRTTPIGRPFSIPVRISISKTRVDLATNGQVGIVHRIRVLFTIRDASRT